MKKIAFIGCGTMGTALATAAAQNISPAEIVVTDLDSSKAAELSRRLGCVQAPDNVAAVESAQYTVFCVKPQFLMPVLQQLAQTFQDCLKRGEHKIVVSIVAGVESATYHETLGIDAARLPVIRMLPNTACLIGKGFTLIMQDDCYTQAQLRDLQEILRFSGSFDVLPPAQFVAGTVLTSTSPAFIAMFANSLADAGVVNGLLRPQARRYALEGILGTVQLFLESDKHLEALKDDVCSPGGPAIMGVKSLEDSGFRSSVINAVVDAYAHFAKVGKIESGLKKR